MCKEIQKKLYIEKTEKEQKVLHPHPGLWKRRKQEGIWKVAGSF